MRVNQTLKDYGEAKEVLAKGMEVLKNLPHNDALLTSTCDSLTLNDTTLAFEALPTNIVGQTIGPTGYAIFWNVAGNYPDSGLLTIRMLVFNKRKEIMQSDFVKWR
jgi:hypothetical protein